MVDPRTLSVNDRFEDDEGDKYTVIKIEKNKVVLAWDGHPQISYGFNDHSRLSWPWNTATMLEIV
jgi:hypothetical protein